MWSIACSRREVARWGRRWDARAVEDGKEVDVEDLKDDRDGGGTLGRYVKDVADVRDMGLSMYILVSFSLRA